MHKTSVYRVLPFVVFALLAPLAWAGDALSFFNNWFVTGDYAVAGVGLRGTAGMGTINMTGVPAGAEPIAAFLYWSTVETSSSAPSARAGSFNGYSIQGVALGSSTTPNLACSSAGGTIDPSTNGRVYRADVLRYLPVDKNNIRQANGNFPVKLAASGAVLFNNGASLVVIYRIVKPGDPDEAPLRAVVIYNGAFTMNKNTAGMTQNVAGFYQASANPAPKITSIVANGQPGFFSPLSVNGTIVDTSPFVGAQKTRWDNPTYNFNLAANASSFSALATASSSQTCLTWAAIIFSAIVTDTDRDGLLDIWETKGLHRNTQVSPATFGACSDYPAEPCENLPAMGADPTKRDIFVQMDWMNGTGDSTGGTDGSGTHDHIPKLPALSQVAATFALHGIRLHFDVGKTNYQGSQSACGNAPCGFIIPAAYAQGGSDIPESTLVCQDTLKHPCDYHQPYPVLSFEFGFASVRDGNKLLAISPHFAQDRLQVFHYALFAHALGGPFNVNGQPVDPFTGLPMTPPTPLSYSGIAHRPGGGFMVTFGLWRSDIPANDQVGSVQAQAGTIMHEMGHNLGLGHAGSSTKPNCLVNYPSIMNYLYQTRGLTDAAGNEQIDYSSGLLLPISENLLSTSIPMSLPGIQRYKVRYYGPLAPSQTASQAAQVHCDGTVIKPGEPFEVRLEGSTVSTPDWSNGTVPLGRVSPPLDVNYDGTTGQTFIDQTDWLSLNLRQIGTGYNFGGMSVGAFATDGGAYATDGGAFATDAGALATDGGVFATDGGAFATDGGAFATDGGAFATDGGAFATDAGELDHRTVLLSSVDPPTAVSARNTTNSIVVSWTPPDNGKLNYNVYRCAGAGCVPSKPAFRNVTGGTATPSFTDTVNDYGHGGTACPPTATCPNTIYVYSVTSLALVNLKLAESVFSKTATSEVKVQFVVPDSKTVTYDGTTQSVTFHVYGDFSVALNQSLVRCTTARNAATYPVSCMGPNTSSPTDAVVYVPSGGVYIDNAGTHTGGSLTINKRPITVTAALFTRTYDGTINAAASPTITTGTLGAGDSPNFSETYIDKNVGMGKTMIPSGFVNDTNSGNNYTVTFVNSANGKIDPAPLTITAKNQSKIYGTTFSFAGTEFTTGTLYSNTDTVTSVTLTSSGTPASATVGGSPYSIAPSAAAGTGLTNYIITYVNGSLTVNPAPLTITASSATVTYGATAPIIGSGFSGFVNNEGSTVLTTQPICVTSYVQGSPVSGSPYPSSCSGAVGANYTIGYVPGTVTVNRAALQITASSAIVNYGASAPTIGSSFSGFVNNEGSTVLTTQPMCVTSYVQGSPVSGSPYPSSCSGAVDGNYTISYVPGTVTVNRAALQITASSAIVTYGATAPIIGSSFSGFVNNENSLALTTQPICGTGYVQGSPVSGSPYPTLCSGAVDGNYTISYMPGIVTVNQAALQITASSPTVALGAAVPIITPGFSGFVNSETSSALTTQPTCSTTYTQGSPVSSYPTSCSGAVDNNYTIGYTAGTLTVTGAALQITTGPVTGFENFTYPATLLTATGGTPPYTWSGASIVGMSLTTGGVLTGLPTAEGTATVTVTDANNISTSVPITIVGPVSTQGAGGPSVTTISHVNLTGGAVYVQQITTTPGAPVTVNFDYSLVEGTAYCPGCIDQLVVAFVNTKPTSCVYDGQPGPGGTSGSALPVNLTAPNTPGRYYIAYHKYQQYYCDTVTTGTALSPSDSVIAVVDVIPTASVTWQNVTLTGISVTPQVSPGGQITAMFNWSMPASGTIGFGFNTDSAMIQCGGLNYGPAAPTFTAPLLPGRYYLSIDNPNTCLQTPALTPWQSGIPGSDFTRYIGAIDVQ